MADTATEAEKSETRVRVISEIKEFWKSVLSSTTFKDSYVIGKVLYFPKGGTEKVIRCFGSELSKGDVFVEFTDFDYNLINSGARELYVIKHDVDYKTKFEEVTKDNFVIPLSALKLFTTYKGAVGAPVAVEKVAPAVVKTFTDFGSTAGLTDELEDTHQSHMTIRDFAAIMWKKPISNKPWLNKLVNEQNS